MTTESWARSTIADGEMPNQSFKAIICRETARLCVERYGSALVAVILTGSQARDEGTCVTRGEVRTVLGDAEFVVVFKNRSLTPEPSALAQLCDGIQKAVALEKIVCSIGLSGVDPGFLHALKPSIFAFELRQVGKVLVGDARILEMIPNFESAAIPLEDGWRILQNRIVEMLDIPADCDVNREALPEALYYRTVKLYLDMATSLLVFAGEYAPTYRERALRLRNLQIQAFNRALPVFMDDLVAMVSLCTEWKTNGTPMAIEPNWRFWEDAIRMARQLWRWELAKVTGFPTQSDDAVFTDAWMARQTRADRLRGWLSTAKRVGWHSCWSQGVRWAPRIWKASPRYWIYAAASEFLFSLPAALQTVSPAEKWGRLLENLPLRNRSKDKPDVWREVAAEIYLNYAQLLMDTRA